METFLRRRDLPAFCRSGDITDPKFKLYAAEGKGLLNSRSYADGVLAQASEQRTEILVGFSARTLLNGESLEMCAERAVAYFKDNTVPQLDSEKNIYHCVYLDKLTSEEVISLELSTGIPILYIFKEKRFLHRGSSAGPTEAGVYAYTKTLAQYRQKLDDMCPKRNGLSRGVQYPFSKRVKPTENHQNLHYQHLNLSLNPKPPLAKLENGTVLHDECL
nr:uncharacterized protein LOC109149398 [Ipomoea trifida]